MMQQIAPLFFKASSLSPSLVVDLSAKKIFQSSQLFLDILCSVHLGNACGDRTIKARVYQVQASCINDKKIPKEHKPTQLLQEIGNRTCYLAGGLI